MEKEARYQEMQLLKTENSIAMLVINLVWHSLK